MPREARCVYLKSAKQASKVKITSPPLWDRSSWSPLGSPSGFLSLFALLGMLPWYPCICTGRCQGDYKGEVLGRRWAFYSLTVGKCVFNKGKGMRTQWLGNMQMQEMKSRFITRKVCFLATFKSNVICKSNAYSLFKKKKKHLLIYYYVNMKTENAAWSWLFSLCRFSYAALRGACYFRCSFLEPPYIQILGLTTRLL